MNFFSEDKKELWSIVIIIFLLIAISLIGYVIFKIRKFNIPNIECPLCERVEVIENNITDEKEEKEPENFFVDIKGAIVNPGVYLVNEETIVNDVITLAGGLKNNAYTKNINLSKKVISEMVIVIYTRGEIDEKNTIKECVCEDVNINNCLDNNASIIVPGNNLEDKKDENIIDTNTKININTATLEELMKLNGIGEAKAKAILEYRNNNGSFKSIEDIKNVSGISDNLYEKIKNNITV